MKTLTYIPTPPDLPDKILVATSTYGSLCRLIKENEGYIFRDIKEPKYGMTGHHKYKWEAVNSVVHWKDKGVFSFESEEEFQEWLKNI